MFGPFPVDRAHDAFSPRYPFNVRCPGGFAVDTKEEWRVLLGHVSPKRCVNCRSDGGMACGAVF